MMMSGCPQGVILLATSAIAVDAGGCPVINGFAESAITGVPHGYCFLLAALLGDRRCSGVTA
jgi:hypothetical protein